MSQTKSAEMSNVNAVAKSRQRHRLAAMAFLSNISLDGNGREIRWRPFMNKKSKARGAKGWNSCLKSRASVTSTDIDVHTNIEPEPSTSSDIGTTSPVQYKLAINKPVIGFENLNAIHSYQTNLDGKYVFGSDDDDALLDSKEPRARLFSASGRLNNNTSAMLLKKIIHDDKNRINAARSHESLTIGDRSVRNVHVHINEPVVKIEARFIASTDRKHNFKDDCILLVSNQVPIYLFSNLPFNRHQRHSSRIDLVARRRNISGPRPMPAINDDIFDAFALLGIERDEMENEQSFAHFLISSEQKKNNCDFNIAIQANSDAVQPYNNFSDISRKYDEPGNQLYNMNKTSNDSHTEIQECKGDMCHYSADLLDDPELIAGKHRTLLTFPSYVTSLIDYAKRGDLKKELNDKFREKFPHIQLTLSKLRSLKRDMRLINKLDHRIDLLIVSQAYVYFEKLIFADRINKTNRKLCAGSCLLLSAKLNDIKGEALKSLIEKLETVFRFNRKELFATEFAVLVALEFGLHVPTSDIFPHYQRLIYES